MISQFIKEAEVQRCEINKTLTHTYRLGGASSPRRSPAAIFLVIAVVGPLEKKKVDDTLICEMWRL